MSNRVPVWLDMLAGVTLAAAALASCGDAPRQPANEPSEVREIVRNLARRENVLVGLDADRLKNPVVVPVAAIDTSVDRGVALRALLDKVAAGPTAGDRVEAWVRYLQDQIAHPAFAPMQDDGRMVTDPLWILENRLGQCGQTNRTLVDGLIAIGIRARIALLSEHVAAEAYYEGQWHYLDADWVNLGQFVRRPDGVIPSVAEIYADPRLLDSIRPGREWEFYPVNVTHPRTFKPYRQMFTHVRHGAYTTPYYLIKTASPEQERGPDYGWDHYELVQ